MTGEIENVKARAERLLTEKFSSSKEDQALSENERSLKQSLEALIEVFSDLERDESLNEDLSKEEVISSLDKIERLSDQEPDNEKVAEIQREITQWLVYEALSGLESFGKTLESFTTLLRAHDPELSLLIRTVFTQSKLLERLQSQLSDDSFSGNFEDVQDLANGFRKSRQELLSPFSQLLGARNLSRQQELNKSGAGPMPEFQLLQLLALAQRLDMVSRKVGYEQEEKDPNFPIQMSSLTQRVIALKEQVLSIEEKDFLAIDWVIELINCQQTLDALEVATPPSSSAKRMSPQALFETDSEIQDLLISMQYEVLKLRLDMWRVKKLATHDKDFSKVYNDCIGLLAEEDAEDMQSLLRELQGVEPETLDPLISIGHVNENERLARLYLQRLFDIEKDQKQYGQEAENGALRQRIFSHLRAQSGWSANQIRLRLIAREAQTSLSEWQPYSEERGVTVEEQSMSFQGVPRSIPRQGHQLEDLGEVDEEEEELGSLGDTQQTPALSLTELQSSKNIATSQQGIRGTNTTDGIKTFKANAERLLSEKFPSSREKESLSATEQRLIASLETLIEISDELKSDRSIESANGYLTSITALLNSSAPDESEVAIVSYGIEQLSRSIDLPEETEERQLERPEEVVTLEQVKQAVSKAVEGLEELNDKLENFRALERDNDLEWSLVSAIVTRQRYMETQLQELLEQDDYSENLEDIKNFVEEFAHTHKKELEPFLISLAKREPEQSDIPTSSVPPLQLLQLTALAQEMDRLVREVQYEGREMDADFPGQMNVLRERVLELQTNLSSAATDEDWVIELVDCQRELRSFENAKKPSSSERMSLEALLAVSAEIQDCLLNLQQETLKLKLDMPQMKELAACEDNAFQRHEDAAVDILGEGEWQTMLPLLRGVHPNVFEPLLRINQLSSDKQAEALLTQRLLELEVERLQQPLKMGSSALSQPLLAKLIGQQGESESEVLINVTLDTLRELHLGLYRESPIEVENEAEKEKLPPKSIERSDFSAEEQARVNDLFMILQEHAGLPEELIEKLQEHYENDIVYGWHTVDAKEWRHDIDYDFPENVEDLKRYESIVTMEELVKNAEGIAEEKNNKKELKKVVPMMKPTKKKDTSVRFSHTEFEDDPDTKINLPPLPLEGELLVEAAMQTPQETMPQRFSRAPRSAPKWTPQFASTTMEEDDEEDSIASPTLSSDDTKPLTQLPTEPQSSSSENTAGQQGIQEADSSKQRGDKLAAVGGLLDEEMLPEDVSTSLATEQQSSDISPELVPPLNTRRGLRRTVSHHNVSEPDRPTRVTNIESAIHEEDELSDDDLLFEDVHKEGMPQISVSAPIEEQQANPLDEVRANSSQLPLERSRPLSWLTSPEAATLSSASEEQPEVLDDRRKSLGAESHTSVMSSHTLAFGGDGDAAELQGVEVEGDDIPKTPGLLDPEQQSSFTPGHKREASNATSSDGYSYNRDSIGPETVSALSPPPILKKPATLVPLPGDDEELSESGDTVELSMSSLPLPPDFLKPESLDNSRTPKKTIQSSRDTGGPDTQDRISHEDVEGPVTATDTSEIVPKASLYTYKFTGLSASPDWFDLPGQVSEAASYVEKTFNYTKRRRVAEMLNRNEERPTVHTGFNVARRRAIGRSSEDSNPNSQTILKLEGLPQTPDADGNIHAPVTYLGEHGNKVYFLHDDQDTAPANRTVVYERKKKKLVVTRKGIDPYSGEVYFLYPVRDQTKKSYLSKMIKKFRDDFNGRTTDPRFLPPELKFQENERLDAYPAAKLEAYVGQALDHGKKLGSDQMLLVSKREIDPSVTIQAGSQGTFWERTLNEVRLEEGRKSDDPNEGLVLARLRADEHTFVPQNRPKLGEQSNIQPDNVVFVPAVSGEEPAENLTGDIEQQQDKKETKRFNFKKDLGLGHLWKSLKKRNEASSSKDVQLSPIAPGDTVLSEDAARSSKLPVQAPVLPTVEQPSLSNDVFWEMVREEVKKENITEEAALGPHFIRATEKYRKDLKDLGMKILENQIVNLKLFEKYMEVNGLGKDGKDQPEIFFKKKVNAEFAKRCGLQDKHVKEMQRLAEQEGHATFEIRNAQDSDRLRSPVITRTATTDSPGFVSNDRKSITLRVFTGPASTAESSSVANPTTSKLLTFAVLHEEMWKDRHPTFQHLLESVQSKQNISIHLNSLAETANISRSQTRSSVGRK